MLVEIEHLSVEFSGLRAVDGLYLQLEEGEVLGIVGESGSGKSVSSLALMGLIDYPGRVTAEQLRFGDYDLLKLSPAQHRALLGKQMAMIFQDPMTSLDPCYTVGYQIIETLRVHEGGSKRALRERALELLRQVGIPDPASRLQAYPHQLSGGMSQRVMIAMAIACNPRLLIADEPTTALDVTIQAQIMRLLAELQRQRSMALILITHDLAVVAQHCQRMMVMYAGQVVESGPVEQLFNHPLHPYTQALLNALPEHRLERSRLTSLPGVVPGQYDRPSGCLLHPRCPYAQERCLRQAPDLRPLDMQRQVRCHTPLDAQGRPSHG